MFSTSESEGFRSSLRRPRTGDGLSHIRGRGASCFQPFAQIDVDKAWHGIHYFLTGQAWEGKPPLNFIVLGGREIAEDMGYGPPRAFSTDEVRSIAAAIAPITAASLEDRYDPHEFAKQQIYPEIWVRDGKDAFSYVAS